MTEKITRRPAIRWLLVCGLAGAATGLGVHTANADQPTAVVDRFHTNRR
jgi:hypothetical protein